MTKPTTGENGSWPTRSTSLTRDITTLSLIHIFGCTAAFLAGLGLWWGFFKLCGFALAREKIGSLSKPARWGGALIGLIRQCCCGVLLIGAVAPVAWLCGIPPEMLQLEKTFLARLAWHLFNRLGIWL